MWYTEAGVVLDDGPYPFLDGMVKACWVVGRVAEGDGASDRTLMIRRCRGDQGMDPRGCRCTANRHWPEIPTEGNTIKIAAKTWG